MSYETFLTDEQQAAIREFEEKRRADREKHAALIEETYQKSLKQKPIIEDFERRFHEAEEELRVVGVALCNAQEALQAAYRNRTETAAEYSAALAAVEAGGYQGMIAKPHLPALRKAADDAGPALVAAEAECKRLKAEHRAATEKHGKARLRFLYATGYDAPARPFPWSPVELGHRIKEEVSAVFAAWK